MKKVITREMVETWNRLAEATRGTQSFYTFTLYKEYFFGTRWHEGGWSLIRNGRYPHPSDRYYIKTVKGTTYLYFEDCAEKERWILGDLAKAFFGIGEK